MKQHQDGLDTKARIIIAACEMIDEDPASTLSVRTVAARAGVSMGSLRHHFPTQRALRDAVLETIYDVVAPDGQIIHDKAVPARDRLVQCLRQVLRVEIGEQSRQAWIKFFDAFIAAEPTDDIRTAYLAMASEGERRIEHWLTILAKEDALPESDIAAYAKLLNTVLNGLSMERALPSDESILQRETEILYTAVDSILSTGSRGRSVTNVHRSGTL
ncbi:TetR/AcrR family transcriptional regulator [Rhodococcus sp. NPDC060090]|uniref:TetR/AcrR family transcriptional regulator n=1 Tax=Rhodococcus sp. NPDC060090 TaxID=3347056 RepID=UPI0036507F0B